MNTLEQNIVHYLIAANEGEPTAALPCADIFRAFTGDFGPDRPMAVVVDPSSRVRLYTRLDRSSTGSTPAEALKARAMQTIEPVLETARFLLRLAKEQKVRVIPLPPSPKQIPAAAEFSNNWYRCPGCSAQDEACLAFACTNIFVPRRALYEGEFATDKHG
jgi:hypothetical protein